MEGAGWLHMERHRKRRKMALALVAVALVCFALLRALSNLNSTLISLAEARAEQRALQQISLALDEVMHKSLDYDCLLYTSDAADE